MTPEELKRRAVALGRRAVACKHWRWMPGMLARYSDGEPWYRLTEEDRRAYAVAKCRPPDWRYSTPDLTDPATLGCLLALVREAYPKHTLWVAPDCVEDPLDDTEFILDEPRACTVRGASEVSCYVTGLGRGRTEAEALVAALEAADDQ